MRDSEVAVFVLRKGRTEVLVAHRAPEHGAYWHTIAGGIEPGEKPAAAALRSYAIDDTAEMPVHSYLVDAPDDWEPTLDWEHDSYRWCAPDEACASFHWPETSETLRLLLAAP